MIHKLTLYHKVFYLFGLSFQELYEVARKRKFECLHTFCPLFDRCPNHHEFPLVDKIAWLARNCPKVREKAYEERAKRGEPIVEY